MWPPLPTVFPGVLQEIDRRAGEKEGVAVHDHAGGNVRGEGDVPAAAVLFLTDQGDHLAEVHRLPLQLLGSQIQPGDI